MEVSKRFIFPFLFLAAFSTHPLARAAENSGLLIRLLRSGPGDRLETYELSCSKSKSPCRIEKLENNTVEGYSIAYSRADAIGKAFISDLSKIKNPRLEGDAILFWQIESASLQKKGSLTLAHIQDRNNTAKQAELRAVLRLEMAIRRVIRESLK